MAQRTKKQHLVPRFYLSRFCDADGLVWSYRASKEPLALKPEATAVETNFYSPIGPDGERLEEVETILGTIESGAAPLWNAISDSVVLTGEDRDRLALFLAAQYSRSPSTVRAGAEMAAYFLQQTAQFIAGNKRAHDQSIDAYEVDSGKKILLKNVKRCAHSFRIQPISLSMCFVMLVCPC